MKRILFVDDEDKILSGLKRMLRGQRREWEMAFVDSGKLALEAMERYSFDVIVSDMRMPGMDGATLLGHVKERHPGTVRIIFSGHSELEAAMRSIGVAHQYIAKPCDSEVIRGVITRACELQELLSQPELLETVGGITTLPALPRVYNQLVAAIADPDVNLNIVAGIVEQDTAISAKILQLVNSSFFGVSREIAGIREATAYLGMNMVRNLTLSVEVFQAFNQSTLPKGMSLESEHAHSTLTARIARRIPEDRDLSENAFLAAMLHDVGKLILGSSLPEQFEQVREQQATSHEPFFRVEQELRGTTHAELGAYLLGVWGMPHAIVEAVAYHHRPSCVEHDELGVLGIVHVADCLAREQSDPDCGAAEWLDQPYLDALGLGPQLDAWRELAEEEAQAGSEQAA